MDCDQLVEHLPARVWFLHLRARRCGVAAAAQRLEDDLHVRIADASGRRS